MIKHPFDSPATQAFLEKAISQDYITGNQKIRKIIISGIYRGCNQTKFEIEGRHPKHKRQSWTSRSNSAGPKHGINDQGQKNTPETD